MRGDIDLSGGPNFGRLYHKLKVLLLLTAITRCNLSATIPLKLIDLYLIAFKFALNNAASIQKNRGDELHHVIIVASLILL